MAGVKLQGGPHRGVTHQVSHPGDRDLDLQQNSRESVPGVMKVPNVQLEDGSIFY